MTTHKYKRMTFQDRKELSRLYQREVRIAEIADRLGVHQATIYHELQRGYTGKEDQNHRPAYDPVKAQQTLKANIKRRGRRS